MAGETAEKKWNTDSTLECPQCHEIVTVGFGGEENLKIHKKSNKCKATIAKRAAEEEKKKPRTGKGTLFSLGIQKLVGTAKSKSVPRKKQAGVLHSPSTPLRPAMPTLTSAGPSSYKTVL
ncbi:hypothetical protein CONPUDRAFT_160412 [Coniophora puteana RWD-64-598 SS2]|uniref:Uncharacterized protein n=1 Tax=Coniophora puteana (strain RWD-64-598) TaxID=741705 RepID=R7SDS2_CONPW|nr:uncharacterized protein CONPUDRAFT_160412 [Coniophora puteana RWD-64-598 SS2]EIW74025.1 hypothetical protein CONPUDRAFT_160412 [Coniophora puteana RWD-64-598 SS2]